MNIFFNMYCKFYAECQYINEENIVYVYIYYFVVSKLSQLILWLCRKEICQNVTVEEPVSLSDNIGIKESTSEHSENVNQVIELETESSTTPSVENIDLGCTMKTTTQEVNEEITSNKEKGTRYNILIFIIYIFNLYFNIYN